MAASTRPRVTRPSGTSAGYGPCVTDLQQWLTERVRESPMNQREIAEAVGITQKHMTALMRGHAEGTLTTWQEILDVIGARLPAEPG